MIFENIEFFGTIGEGWLPSSWENKGAKGGQEVVR
jgi:hypothetical protein